MKNRDQSQRFLFEDHPIRGQYVSLDESWRQIVQQSGVKGKGLCLLGEALAAVVLLVDTLKIEGSIILQIRGTGPLELLVVEANSKDQVRGIARQQGKIDERMDLQELFGSDHLVITIKTDGAEPYQGIASLRGANLSEALEYYFATSEQLATHFWLACDEDNVSGMLIQRLPGESKDSDAWGRILHLASTISHQELQLMPINDLLHRLFHEETLRLFDPGGVEFFCGCSRERTMGMLLTLGKQEVYEILEKEGEISVTCEFCNANYRFDGIDVEGIFTQSGLGPATTITH